MTKKTRQEDSYLRRTIVTAEYRATQLEHIAEILTNPEVFPYLGGLPSAMDAAHYLRVLADSVRRDATTICVCHPQASWELVITPHQSMKDWEAFPEVQRERKGDRDGKS